MNAWYYFNSQHMRIPNAKAELFPACVITSYPWSKKDIYRIKGRLIEIMLSIFIASWKNVILLLLHTFENHIKICIISWFSDHLECAVKHDSNALEKMKIGSEYRLRWLVSIFTLYRKWRALPYCLNNLLPEYCLFETVCRWVVALR